MIYGKPKTDYERRNKILHPLPVIPPKRPIVQNSRNRSINQESSVPHVWPIDYLGKSSQRNRICLSRSPLRMGASIMKLKFRNREQFAKSLLTAAVKWIRRIEERKEEIPSSFFDNCDPKPLRKRIENYLSTNRVAIPRPTIEELEEILSKNCDLQMQILPDGSVTMEKSMIVEEDGDEIFTPMPEYCEHLTKRLGHSERVKLVVEKGFLVCPECHCSYGPTKQKS